MIEIKLIQKISILNKLHLSLRFHQSRKLSSMNNKVQAALVDLSGTLHIENDSTPGAQKALERLRNAGVKVKFVTNTTKESMRLLHERLIKLGFDIKQNEIFSSLTAARNLVEARRLRPLLLLEDCAKEDFTDINEENPNAVVVGLSPSCFDYGHMNQAFRLLLNGAPLIAIHKARYYKKSDGLFLGPGPFVSGLEYATDIKAEVVGKPERTFFLEAVKDLNVGASQTVMIGDDVRDDIGGAIKTGMMGVLVKTGKYRIGDESTIDPRPTAVCEDFSHAVVFILEQSCT